MPGETAPLIITQPPHLRASPQRCVIWSTYARSTMDIDAEREQAVKETLDAIGYRLGFFRDYDEPNESFASRLSAHIDRLVAAFGLSNEASHA